MTEEQIEDMLQELESARNFMLGMALDPSLPKQHANALTIKANKIDEYLAPIVVNR